MAGTRLGRNVPLSDAKFDEKNLLTPNPRTVSRVLLARNEFQPATILNLLAAAWIQFQTHDWFTHGKNQSNNKFQIPVEKDDPWSQEQGPEPIPIKKTIEDPTRTGDTKNPPSFINEVTHWWDASQIYGSDQETIDKLRSHIDGKLHIGEDGLLPIENGVEQVGFAGTWWIGLSLLHSLFVNRT